MTVLEQLLIVAVFVLLCGIGLMRTHIRETRKLLAQVRADRTTQAAENRKLRAEMIADTHRQTDRVKAITEDLRSMNGYTAP